MEAVRRCYGCMSEWEEGNFCPKCGHNNQEEPKNQAYIKPGTIINNYLIGKVLVETKYEVAYLAFDHQNNRKVSMKEFLPTELVTRMNGSLMVIAFPGEKEERFRAGLAKFKKAYGGRIVTNLWVF